MYEVFSIDIEQIKLGVGQQTVSQCLTFLLNSVKTFVTDYTMKWCLFLAEFSTPAG